MLPALCILIIAAIVTLLAINLASWVWGTVVLFIGLIMAIAAVGPLIRWDMRRDRRKGDYRPEDHSGDLELYRAVVSSSVID